MADSSKPARNKPATGKNPSRLPKDRTTLRRARRALHSFCEQLRTDLDSAVAEAKTRRLGAPRYVEHVCRYLLHRQGAAQSTERQTTPRDVEISADLAAGLRCVDWGVLSERVEAWSGILTQLAAYEGQAFKRKRLLLGKRGHADDAEETRDTEGEALAALEQEAMSLIGVFQDAASGLKQRLNTASAKCKKTNRKAAGSKLSVTEVAERLRVSRDKVLKWIDSKELPATNVASAGSTRTRWRIDEKDLAEFERRRQPTKPPPSSTRKRRQKSPDVTEYF